MNSWTEEALRAKLEENPDLTITKEGLRPLPLQREGEVRHLTISKYHNRRTNYNGKLFDSQKEADRARDNDLRIKASELSFYLTQVPIRLPGKVVYRLDFVEFIRVADTPLFEVAFVEVKGFRTKTGEAKRKIAEAILGIDIEVI